MKTLPSLSKSPLLLTSLCLIIFGLACRSEVKKEPEAAVSPTQMERVVAIHDSVMPKMGHIGRLVARLKPLVDSTEQGIAYQLAMRDLQDANTAMMEWMKGFGDRFNHDEIMNGKALSDQKKVWLDEEEVKVKALQDKFNGSIERAEAILAISDSLKTGD